MMRTKYVKITQGKEMSIYTDTSGNVLKNDQGGYLRYNQHDGYDIVETTYSNGDPYQSIHYVKNNLHGHQSLPIHPKAKGNPGVTHGPRIDVDGNQVPKNSPYAHWEVKE